MPRWAGPRDASELGEVFHRSVRADPSPYTEAQRAAWSPCAPSGADWAARLDAQATVVADDAGRIVGFMSLRPDGCIDLAFILPEARGRGLFRRLFLALETHARGQGLPRLRTHASLMAEPAFRAVGFRVIQRQVVPRGDQFLARAEMEKLLT